MADMLILIPNLAFQKPIIVTVSRSMGVVMSRRTGPLTGVLALRAAAIITQTHHSLKLNTTVSSPLTKILEVVTINQGMVLIRVALIPLTTRHQTMEIMFVMKAGAMKTRATTIGARISMPIDITVAPARTVKVLMTVAVAERTGTNMISIKEKSLPTKIEATSQPIKVAKTIVHTKETTKRTTTV